MKADGRRPVLLSLAWWTFPSLFCLALYWNGLWVWFCGDDFAWLGLRQDLERGRIDLWSLLFAPKAQGTIRPWSERLFYLTFERLFGYDPLPFRLWVFLTQFCNLALIAAITRRVTASAAAGFCAPILWAANGALVGVMSWTPVYNQALCAFFILTAFYFLLRYIDTGRRRYAAGQWAAFLLGFGALELNVVYPALAASYTWLRARPHFNRTLPLFAPSIGYAMLHRSIAPSSGGAYALHLDGALPATLWNYWQWALGPRLLEDVLGEPQWFAAPGTALLTAGALAFLALRIARRDTLPLFFLAWFGITLAPVLPLRDHVTDYYLTIPAIGLAMFGAWAIACARVRGAQLAAGGLTAIFLATSMNAAWAGTEWRFGRSRDARLLVLGVVRARQAHPDQAILLDGITRLHFGDVIVDDPFRLYGVRDVYLTPGTETRLPRRPEVGEVSDFILPASATLAALRNGQAQVYQVRAQRLRNVTSRYALDAREALKPEEPRRVDVGSRLLANLLLDGWLPAEDGNRWMGKTARLRMGGPKQPGERLRINGYCPEVQLERGPVKLRVAVDGKSLGETPITTPGSFFCAFNLPPELTGRDAVEVSVDVDRTFTPPDDGRKLGLVFGVFEIR
ncbi:MAG: hypothetical protein WD696_09050 [Bryobacteraceae bacterium]